MKVESFLQLFTIDLRDIFISIFAIFGFLVFVAIFTYIYFAQDLQNRDSLINKKDTGVVLLDAQDRPFFSFYQGQYKKFIPLSEIPKLTQEAVIASEDKGFYNHPGFSIMAIARSLVTDVTRKELAYGGSTITQQLVKNALLNNNKDFLRKFQEVVLAQEIERRYSKQKILEMYLNSVYFGSGAFGIDEAAQIYFNKQAKDLDLAQSTLLAGILPAPSTFSPFVSPTKAKLRQREVLGKMLDQGYISQSQKDQADGERLFFNPSQSNIEYKAPHFALLIKQELENKYGEEVIARSGFKVQTSLDLDWQEYAQQVVKTQVDKLKTSNVSNGAAVVIDVKTGEIKALVGSTDWNNEQFGKVNMATTPRQPGSSFKPIVYSAAFEQRILTPAAILEDKPTTFPGNYKPLDYDHKFRGPVLARRALANSLNIPAVQVLSKIGIPSALDMAQRVGITTLGHDLSQYGLSLTLGTGEVKLVELTNVYAVFANNGQQNPPTSILLIEDKYGQQIYSYTPHPQEVIEPEVAYLITSILSDKNTRAEEFGNTLDTAVNAAVKTGTTEDYKDAWTLGYTPNLAVGVWIGNNIPKTMDQIAGSIGAAPIFRDLIDKFSQNYPKEQFKVPQGIVTESVCRYSGLKLKEATSSGYLEYFIKGTEPIAYCNVPNASSSSSH